VRVVLEEVEGIVLEDRTNPYQDVESVNCRSLVEANPSLNALEVIANGLGLDIFELFKLVGHLRTVNIKNNFL
jgi:hypothetical protein